MQKLFITLLLSSSVISGSAKDNDLHAQIVLFHQADKKPAGDHTERLRSLGRYVEGFLGREMKRWQKPIERTQIFARDAKGKIKVTVVSGTLASGGRQALPEIRTRALRGAGQQLRIPPDKPVVWWIFYDYAGVKGFQGGARGSGGMAINAYPPGDGTFDSTHDLAAPEFAAANVKGTVHEFGHALGLPHIGPRPGLKLGNSLMGPVNRAFWGKSGTDDTRVHLSEVSAAMLWRHPIFQPDATATPEQPDDLKVKALKATEANGGIVISGQLVSGQSAHSAVLLDSERGRFGDYWARPYSSLIDQQTGRFSITIEEPFRSGTAYLSFSLENGLTSDGDKPFQRGSKLEVTYQGEPGSREIEIRKQWRNGSP